MANLTPAGNPIEVDGHRFDLRNRSLAALLAWLIPGAGHYYQGRKSKAVMFCIAILVTYFVGFAIGGGHVVYASWAPNDKRWNYACQIGVGIAALPALVQTHRLRQYTDEEGLTAPDYTPLWGGLMAPPRRPIFEENPDDIAAWYARMGAGYEMGTWYTMIAGLLNILVIYDAYSGPLSTPISGRRREESADEEDEDADGSSASRAQPNSAAAEAQAGEPVASEAKPVGRRAKS